MAAQAAEKQALQPEPENPNAKKQKRIEAAQQRDAIRKATKHLSERVKKLEAETGALEDAIKVVDEQLADPETYKDSGKIRELTTRKSELEGKLEATFDAWMSA